MLYNYEDNFLIKKVDDVLLQTLEDNAVAEANKLNIADEFYKEKFIKAKVYAKIALLNLEAEGMSEKYEAYKKELSEIYNLAKTNSNSNISSLSLSRG